MKHLHCIIHLVNFCFFLSPSPLKNGRLAFVLILFCDSFVLLLCLSKSNHDFHTRAIS